MSVLEEYVGFLKDPESVTDAIKDKFFHAIPIHGQLMLFNHETNYIMFMSMTEELGSIPVYSKIKIENITASDVSKLGNDAFNVLKLELQVLVYVKQDPFFSENNFVRQTWTGVYMVPMNISLEAVEVEAKKQGIFSKLKLPNIFSRKAPEDSSPTVDIVATTQANEELMKFMDVLHKQLGPLQNAIGTFNSAYPNVDYDNLENSIVKNVNDNVEVPQQEMKYMYALGPEVIRVSYSEIVDAYRQYKSIRKIGDNDLATNSDYIQYMAIIDHLVGFMNKLKGIKDNTQVQSVQVGYTVATNLRSKINNYIVPLQNELETVRGVRSGMKDVGKTVARLTGRASDAITQTASRVSTATVRALTDPTNARGKLNEVFKNVKSAPPAVPALPAVPAVPTLPAQAGGSKTKQSQVSKEKSGKRKVKNHKK